LKTKISIAIEITKMKKKPSTTKISWKRGKRLAGVRTTPRNAKVASFPDNATIRENFLSSSVLEKYNGIEMKKFRNPSPNPIRAMINNVVEMKFSSPEYATVRPKSLKKLLKNEYPRVLGSSRVPPA
jgi:hypothetical protein